MHVAGTGRMRHLPRTAALAADVAALAALAAALAAAALAFTLGAAALAAAFAAPTVPIRPRWRGLLPALRPGSRRQASSQPKRMRSIVCGYSHV